MGSSAFTILQKGNALPCVRRRDRLVHPAMGFERGPELDVQALLLRLRQLRRALQVRLGSPRQRQDRLSQLQQVRFRLGAPVSQTPSPSLGTGARSGASAS